MLYKYKGSLHTRMHTHTPPDEQNQSSSTAELRLPWAPTEEDTRPKVLILGEWRKVPDGHPGDASRPVQCDQLFINDLATQLLAELHAASHLTSANPKSSDLELCN